MKYTCSLIAVSDMEKSKQFYHDVLGMNVVADFGANVTAADFVFVAACLIKLLPMIPFPLWLWLWIGGIALIKAINLLSGYIVQKRFVTMHTMMNKTTGILLFVLPLTVPIVALKYSAPLVCTAATFAAIQEGHYIRTGRDDL